jgi:hypothetical protein
MATISRIVRLPAGSAEAWQLISTAQGWKKWLVDRIDAVDGELVPGRHAVVHDGDTIKNVVVYRAADSTVSFSWWEPDDAESVSHVELSVVEIDGACELRIVEHNALSPADSEVRSAAWEVRVLSLWACCVAAALV